MARQVDRAPSLDPSPWKGARLVRSLKRTDTACDLGPNSEQVEHAGPSIALLSRPPVPCVQGVVFNGIWSGIQWEVFRPCLA